MFNNNITKYHHKTPRKIVLNVHIKTTNSGQKINSENVLSFPSSRSKLTRRHNGRSPRRIECYQLEPNTVWPRSCDRSWPFENSGMGAAVILGSTGEPAASEQARGLKRISSARIPRASRLARPAIWATAARVHSRSAPLMRF